MLADIEEPVNIEDTVTVTEPETAEESATEEAPETVEEPAADEAPETAVEAALIEELTVEEAPTDAGQGKAIAEEPAEIERPDADEEEPISLDAEIEEVSEELDAELAGEIYEGNCGDNVKWRLDGDSGTLTVSGSGAMYNHLAGSQAQPWYSQRSLIKSVIIGRGVTHIGSYTFIGCRNLYDAIIPDTVTSVGSSAFASSGLQLVKVPASVTQIGQDAFGSVHLLSAGPTNSGCNFEFGWTDKIPDNAFTGMSKLQSVQLPSTVTEIGVGVFSSSDLTSINLPKSLKTIRASAFNGCIDLEEVYYAGTEADWKKITIENWNDPLTRATIHYGPAPIETGWEKADDGSWQYWNPDGSYVAADWKNIDASGTILTRTAGCRPAGKRSAANGTTSRAAAS